MRNIEIAVKGHLGKDWSDWFGSFEITQTIDGTSTLTGPIRDQAELRGILSHLADLGLELISVNTLKEPSTPQRPVRGGGKGNTQGNHDLKRTEPEAL